MTPPKEIVRIGQIELRFLLDGDDTAGRMTVFEFVVPPAARVPAPHYHDQVDEMVYGLDGELTFTVDGRPNRVGPGDRCFVPRGVVHGFANAGATTARCLAVLTPASIGPAAFRDMAALVATAAAVARPPDPADLAAVMRRHGLVAVPPPSPADPS